MQSLISLTGRWYITFTNKTVLTTFVYFTHYSIIIVQARYITIETKEVARIWYNGLLFPYNLLSGEGLDAPRPSPEYSSGKRNPLYAIRETFFFFNSSTLSYTSYRSVSINFGSTKFVICSPLRRPIRYKSTKSWSIEQLSCCYFFSSKLWRYFECEWWVAWHVPLPVGEWINRLSKFTKHLIRLTAHFNTLNAHIHDQSL